MTPQTVCISCRARISTGFRNCPYCGGILTVLQHGPGVIREREVIRDVAMIPCKHCGGLMPQTATFCPNCAASR